MPPWWVPSITAISLLAVTGAAAGAETGGADRVAALIAAVAQSGPAVDARAAAEIRARCAGDALCAGRLLSERDPRMRLERIDHPDSDTIRWVTSRPSVTEARILSDGRSFVRLDRFGRKATRELRAAVTELRAMGASEELVIDLRGNAGGDLGRMARVAGQLAGAVKNAFYLVDKEIKNGVDISLPSDTVEVGRITLLVGGATASSAEILAALLRRYAGAEVLGTRTRGKDYLLRIVPLAHDWRLLVPAERVTVPGEQLAGGLRPDAPIPAGLAGLATP